MDGVKAAVIGFAVFFGALFGSLTYSDHMAHVEKMECIKARGESIKGVCVFREAK